MDKDNEIKGNAFSSIIETVFAEEASLVDNCQTISKKISAKEAKLVELIEGLGPKLTSTNVHDRVRATDILSNVFSTLGKDFLNVKELEFIVEFLLNRLKDQHLVIPKAILCVYPIIQCQNLPRGAGTKLLHQIFQEANIQSHVHKIRRTVFLIIAFMLRNKLDEMKEMSTDFVINFLQAIDGEKDPRNLLLLFQIIPTIISNFNLGPFIEDFYEVLACYFPIDFTPTYSVPGSELITRESLADPLHLCLSQTAQFSNFLIPLALEKLDSSLTEAKIDSLRLLELCCERCYKPGNLEEFLPQIWHTLRREIFMGGNEMVEKHSIDFLESAFRVVSTDESVLNTCIELVFTECKHHLCEPELRLIHPTSKILVGICNSSEESCRAIAPKVLSVIHEQLTKKTVGDEKKRLLGITELILSSSQQYSQVNLSELLPNWDQIVATWFSFLTSDDDGYTTLCLKILLRILNNGIDFPLKSRHLLQEHLLSLLRNNISSPEAILTITAIAEKLTLNYSSEFIETSVPTLLEWIPNREESSNVNPSDDDDSIKGKLSYKVLGECSAYNKFVCEKVVSHLLSVINQIDVNARCARGLKCLDWIVEKVSRFKDSSKVLDIIHLLVEKLFVLDRLFELVLFLSKSHQTDCSSINCGDEKNCSVNKTKVSCCREIFSVTARNQELLNTCTKIIRNIIRGSEEELQTNLVKRFWTLKVNDNPMGLLLTEIPLDLIEAVLGPLRPTVKIYRQNELVEYLLERSMADNNGTKSIVVKRLLAVFLNKLEPETEFLKLLERFEIEIDTKLKTVDFNISKDEKMILDEDDGENFHESFETNLLISEEKKQCTCSQGVCVCNKKKLVASSGLISTVELLAWITKSLAMRGLKNLTIWIDKMINLLRSEDVGNVAAEGFNILLTDDVVSLNSESHCKFRFLYKQRIFQMSVPKLVAGYRQINSEISKVNFIQSLSTQLKHIPKDILAMQIENVFPLLVASLKFDSSAPVVLSTLNAFSEMMNNSDEETEKRLIEYFNDIVPELVRFATFVGNMEVRILSLKCLRRFAKCPSHVIIPLRQTVIENLQKALDDPKRLVRKEAYFTRNIWILVGSPGGL